MQWQGLGRRLSRPQVIVAGPQVGLRAFRRRRLIGGRLEETVVKTSSVSPILAVVAAASFALMAVVAPVQEAQAGKGGGARATTATSKFSTSARAAPKLTCVGPYCRRGPSENRPATTGTHKSSGNKAPATWTAQGQANPVRHPYQDAGTRPGGVKVSGGTRRLGAPPQGPRPGGGGCARWPNTPSCHPIVRDHRGPRVVPKEDPPQKW